MQRDRKNNVVRVFACARNKKGNANMKMTRDGQSDVDFSHHTRSFIPHTRMQDKHKHTHPYKNAPHCSATHPPNGSESPHGCTQWSCQAPGPDHAMASWSGCIATTACLCCDTLRASARRIATTCPRTTACFRKFWPAGRPNPTRK
jgi:hypothetical protein